MNKTLLFMVKLVIFVCCMVLIIWGQRTVGYLNLAAQLVGVGGILGLLYLYNKGYR